MAQPVILCFSLFLWPQLLSFAFRVLKSCLKPIDTRLCLQVLKSCLKAIVTHLYINSASLYIHPAD